MRKLFSLAALVVFAALAARAVCAQQQPPQNYVGTDGWRAYLNATAEESGGERVYAVRGEGNLHQAGAIPEEFAGHHVLVTAEARCERCGDGRLTGRPGLYGEMQGAGTSGARVYAYLTGQPSMSYPAEARGEWARLWGVFRVPTGTRKVSLVLQRGSRRGEADDGRVALFRSPAVYVFPSEDDARAFVRGANVLGSVASSEPGAAQAVAGRPCADLPLRGFEVGALRLGMSVGEALAVFPGVAEGTAPRAQVERARGADAHGFSQTVIDARRHTPAPGFEGVERYRLKFLDGRLFDIEAHYPSSWRDAAAFIQSHAGRLGLPPPERWEQVGGYGRFGKYLVCEGAELRFFANGSKRGVIGLIDLSAEQSLAERRGRKATLAERAPD